jgi:hypothetical protein
MLDAILAAQHGNGIAGDHLLLNQVVKEAVDNAGAVQQRRRVPACSPFSQPDLQHLPIDGRVTLCNVLKAVKDPTIIGAASGAAQPQFSQKAGDDGAIGIRPCAHESTSDPGTSSGIVLRSSVASLR